VICGDFVLFFGMRQVPEQPDDPERKSLCPIAQFLLLTHILFDMQSAKRF
jgi:hypothetical protein